MKPPIAPAHPHIHREHGVLRDDPYFWLKEKDDDGNPYLQPIKVYDVRDECARAAIRL